MEKNNPNRLVVTGKNGQEWTVAARDEAVLNHCLGHDIPVVGLISGYDKDRIALAERHGVLHHSVARVWTERDLG